MATSPRRTNERKKPASRSPAAPAPAARAGRDGRLSAHDWIAAGQDLLREEGISAIKLAALTRRLGVSTGSFYHHFPDFEQYLATLAESYSLDRVMHDLENALRDSDPSPVARLQSLARQSLKAGTFELDRAMRIWATMDPRAEAALRRAEATVLAFITDAFLDLGFDPAEASLRARMLLSSNVSPLLPQGGDSRAEFFRGSLRLMVEGAPKPRTRATKRASGGQTANTSAKKSPPKAAKSPSRPATASSPRPAAERRSARPGEKPAVPRRPRTR